MILASRSNCNSTFALHEHSSRAINDELSGERLEMKARTLAGSLRPGAASTPDDDIDAPGAERGDGFGYVFRIQTAGGYAVCVLRVLEQSVATPRAQSKD